MINENKYLFEWKKLLEFGAVAVLSFLFFAYYQFQTQYLPETDGYYHIKMAYLMREMGFLSDFKWAHLSLWRDNFSDKEFLYHVYLIPFTYLKDLAFGGKIATVTMAAIVFTSFYAVLRLNNVAYPWLWLLLLSMSGGFFLYRVNVPRPQGLSIVFVLWTIHFLINRKLIHLALLCFIYTYSYTAYHLPIIFALIISGYLFIFEKELDWKTPAVAAAATMAGMLLSPFFPDNIRLFFLQNFYILYKGSGQEAIMHMGGEFWPMDTRAVIKVNTAVVIPFIAAFFTAIYSPAKWGREVKSVFLIALSLIFLTCNSKRFAEYSVPVTLMFCAFFFSPYLKTLLIKQVNFNKAMLAGALLMFALIALGVNSHNSTVGEFRSGPAGLEPAALWLKENTEENELVYTGDWDDGPELLFFNHKNRYLVFLDPNFMFYWDPEVWKRWDALSNGRLGDQTYDALKNEFKVRYGVATSDFGGLRKIIERDNRMKIVFDSPHAYVFKLDTTHNQPIAEFAPPAVDEVKKYFIEEEELNPKAAQERAAKFMEFYESNQWETGNGKMKDWKFEASRSLTWE